MNRIACAPRCTGAMLLAICAAAQAAESPILSVQISPQRDYGLVIGAPLHAEILIETAPGLELETAALPQPGSAVSDFLELRAADWTQQTENSKTLFRLHVVYQAFKGVRDAETLAVPALPLRFNRAGEAFTAEAPAWKFTLTPIIPANTADEDVLVRGELPPPGEDGKHRLWLLACWVGWAGLGSYAALRLGLLRRRTPPFLRAARALKKLAKQPANADTWRQGARLVHNALNETAGHAVFSGQLSRFLAAQPCYAPLQAELEQFFALSDRLFFSDTGAMPTELVHPPHPSPSPYGKGAGDERMEKVQTKPGLAVAWLEALCRRLAAAGAGP